MKKRLNFSTFLTLILIIISFYDSISQPKWSIIDSPTFSDLNNLFIFSSNSGIAAGKQIIIFNGTSWTKMEPKSPVDVNLLYANNLESIFVVSNNEYQDSEMYYWNGQSWEKFYQPLANSISALEFQDKFNGVVASLGEIAVLQNNKWNFLSPPTSTQLNTVTIKNDSIIWALAFDGLLYKYDKNWESIENKLMIRKMGNFNNKIYVAGNNFIGVVESDSVKIITYYENLSNINSFYVLEDGSITTVGLDGTISDFKDNKWSKIKSPVTLRLNSIKLLKNGEGWCVGADGTLLHFSKKSYSKKNIWHGFEKVTFHSNSKIIDDEYGVVTADFNNDGLTDIFTCGLYENNHLYMNIGNIRFVDEASERGVSGKADNRLELKEYNLGACAADFDNDGNIDLYVSSLNGKNKFYKNTGNGFFVDYTSISNTGGEQSDRTNSVAAADVDNDSDLDIFITNENSSNRLFLNNGAGIFEEITIDVGLTSEKGGTGCSFGDIDNDGDLDLYVTNWSAKNKLYKNLLVENSTLGFIDITDKANVGGYDYTKSNGVVFADIDNDSDLDLFVANRRTSNRLYINDGKGLFNDFTEEYIGLDSAKSYGVVINDFDGDGFKDIYVSNVGGNTFLLNVNGKKFVDNTDKYNAKIKGYSTGSASADFDNDGDLDLYISNYIGESSTILVNKQKTQNYVILNLEGVTSNRSAIGTKIFAYNFGYLNNSDNLIFYCEVNGGSGYGSMSELRQSIPTLDNNQIDIKILFPSAKVQILENVEKGTILNVYEETGFYRTYVSVKNYLFRIFFDWHQLFNLIKWIFVLGLILFSILHGRKKYNWLPKIIIGSSFFIALNYYLLSTVFEYKNFIYSTLLPIAGTITLVAVFHLFYDKIMLRKKVELERQNLQEKLSRDLHDDLASTLGSVSIYLELLKHSIKNNSDSIWPLFNKANILLNNSKQTITDLIWTIKPSPESIANFAARTRENFADIFRERNITFKVSEDESVRSKNLTSIEKHNIYLIIKESLNNILRHSNATNVGLSFSVINNYCIFTITDNGIGFDYSEEAKQGNGLTNLINRAKEINADINIKSVIHEGTTIELRLEK